MKVIYIDPPYNTGNDFVYEVDFADLIAKDKEIISQTTRSNPEPMKQTTDIRTLIMTHVRFGLLAVYLLKYTTLILIMK